jgi:endonuclease-3
MSSSSRTAQYTKLHKVLKKYYKPVVPDANRSVLEHLLFACCLENAQYEAAEEAYAALVHNFFDWNEVRVSTVRELAEVMGRLPEPPAAASRLKRVLQSVFEANYNFELEELRKMNLGPATEKLAKMKGSTPFSAAYVVQAALGGHAIPADSGTLGVMRVLEILDDDDVRANAMPGVERAIPKPKGFEFGSLLHQLGADYVANPYAPSLHEILLEIDPTMKDRLPKRRAKPVEEPAAATAAKPEKGAKKAEPKAEKAQKAEAKPEKPEKAEAKGAARTGEPAAPAGEEKGKRAPAKKKPAEGPSKTEAAKEKPEKPVEHKAASKAAEAKSAERKKAAASVEPEAAGKKKSEATKKSAKEPPARKKDAAEKEKTSAEAGKKETSAKELGVGGLSKRKPR